MRLICGRRRVRGIALGNGVDSTGRKRVTATHAADSESEAANQTVCLEGLDGVLATARIELARANQQRPDDDLVRTNHEHGHEDHRCMCALRPVGVRVCSVAQGKAHHSCCRLRIRRSSVTHETR